MIDLRSDTVTKPTPAMRRAMAEADVGDDVYGEDPTVNRLQERAAEIFEKEAAIFVPTGSMGNQTAVKLHTRPGQEVVIEITKRRAPCQTLNVYGPGIQPALFDALAGNGDPSSPKWGLSGFYASIIQPGVIRPSNEIVLVP